jgi:hypothetical protein
MLRKIWYLFEHWDALHEGYDDRSERPWFGFFIAWCSIASLETISLPGCFSATKLLAYGFFVFLAIAAIMGTWKDIRGHAKFRHGEKILDHFWNLTTSLTIPLFIGLGIALYHPRWSIGIFSLFPVTFFFVDASERWTEIENHMQKPATAKESQEQAAETPPPENPAP